MRLERLMVEMELAFDDVSDNFQFTIARERHFAAEHDVEHDAERPNINLVRVFLQENFRSNVVGTATHR